MATYTATVSSDGTITPNTIQVASGAAVIVYNLDSGATWSATPGIVVNSTAAGTTATFPGPTGSVTSGTSAQQLVYTNPGNATLTFTYAQINVTSSGGSGGGGAAAARTRDVGDSDPVIQNQGGGGGGGGDDDGGPGRFDRNRD